MPTYKEILLKTRIKNEILDIGDDLGIKLKISDKKEACAHLLEKTLLEKPQLIRNVLSYNEVYALSILYGGDNGKKTGFTIDDLDGLFYLGLLDMSIDSAIIGKDDGPIYFAKNIRDSIFPILGKLLANEAYKRAFEIENLIIGLLTLYGALTHDKLHKLINQFIEKPVSAIDIVRYAQGNRRVIRHTRVTIHGNHLYFYNSFIDESHELIDEIEARKKIEYSQFNKSEIIEASNPLYFFNDLQAKKMSEIFDKYDVENKFLLLHQIWFRLQTETSPRMAIDLITSQITFNGMEEVQKMLNILMEYGNNMPRWILKGHSSDSIFEKIEKPRLKSLPDKPDTTTFSFIKPRTGRNEPCPCGSGKKYKNCCGNN